MIATSATAPATANDLWGVVSGVTSWPQVVPTFTAVEPLSPGPTGVGSRFRVHQPGLAAATYEVTEWEPGHAFTWVARTPGITTTARHVVSPHKVGADEVVDKGGPAARLELSVSWSGLLGPAVGAVLSRRAQRMIDAEAKALTSAAAEAAR